MSSLGMVGNCVYFDDDVDDDVDEVDYNVESMLDIQKKGLELFKKKNKDYGDAFKKDGPIGVLVRLGDKINRLKHITKNKIQLVDNETLHDTLIDLHNYSAMAILLLDKKKTCEFPKGWVDDPPDKQVFC